MTGSCLFRNCLAKENVILSLCVVHSVHFYCCLSCFIPFLGELLKKCLKSTYALFISVFKSYSRDTLSLILLLSLLPSMNET